MGATQFVGGFVQGGVNFVAGIKEISKARKDAKLKKEGQPQLEGGGVEDGEAQAGDEGDEGDDGEDKAEDVPPTVAGGLKRATLGLVAPPVQGLGKVK